MGSGELLYSTSVSGTLLAGSYGGLCSVWLSWMDIANGLHRQARLIEHSSTLSMRRIETCSVILAIHQKRDTESHYNYNDLLVALRLIPPSRTQTAN